MDLRNNFPKYHECPCLSQKKAKYCCLSSRQWKKAPVVINPKPPKSSVANSECFANADNDCSETINREHYISRTLLEEIEHRRTIKIGGLTWMPKQTYAKIGTGSLVARVLCDRHNEALGKLDEQISRLSKRVKSYDVSTHPNVTPISEIDIFAGEDIERWMLKALIGLTRSGNVRGKLKPEMVDILFGRRPWPKLWGLYMTHTPGEVAYHSDSFGFQTKMGPNDLVLAFDFILRGIRFTLMMGEPGGYWGTRRPRTLIFEVRGVQKFIELTWQTAEPDIYIKLSRAGVYDGPPPNWEDWQKQ